MEISELTNEVIHLLNQEEEYSVDPLTKSDKDLIHDIITVLKKDGYKINKEQD